MNFEFAFNFRKTFDHIRAFGVKYFKTDVKYLFFFVLGLFIIMFGFLVLILQPLTLPPPQWIQVFFIFVLALLFWFLIFAFYYNWLMVSKGFHVVKLYKNPNLEYSDSLQESKNYRLRSFLGLIIYGMLSAIPIVVLYVILLFSLFSSLTTSPNTFILIFFIFLLVYLVGLVVILFLLIPLQIYPTLLVIEPEISYFEGIKRCYKLLPGVMNKLKFIGLIYLYSLILSFILQFGLYAVGIILFILFFVIALLFTGGTGIELIGLMIIFMLVFFIGFLFITLEGSNIVNGSIYGQVYINMAHPELLEGEIANYKGKKTSFQKIAKQICSNCGSNLEYDAKYCVNCGMEI